MFRDFLSLEWFSLSGRIARIGSLFSGFSGFSGFPVLRAFGGSGLPDNRGFGVPVCGFSRVRFRFRFLFRFRPRLRGGAALQDLFGPRCTWPAFGCCPRSGRGVLRTLHFGLRPFTFYFGCRPGTVCRFRRGVSPVSLPPGAVSGCRRCPRSGGAACASGACRRSSAPPLRARSPGRARVWRSTTARRQSP